ncbi:hypothetical protein A2115_03010 [Candidatus Woesebacteria bacterium GWA1_41_8]|uniref:Glycosyltransferase 2-like domain-containing protein n=1 Tax=Candidatus Woesebacteria bacterium GWA1_41_8 TaxID=1802471 RepID=A0A1F7WIL4_9BACT|nr:MAG: hypothetical protein A2115_03010 [Candidatus Woesebacteria bacterium GWA1_41_8]
MKIWAHTIVKNEERFIWYAISSVVEFVDKILIWDTGSSDLTPEIIREAQKYFGNKIEYSQKGKASPEQIPRLRGEMLKGTSADWVINLDGDEVWWDDSILKLTRLINGKKAKVESVVVGTVNPVGDIFHFLPQDAGGYEISGRKGHLNLRAFSTRITGLHVSGIYPKEAYCDASDSPLQEKNPYFLDVSYLHLTHLKRSFSNLDVVGRIGKFKYELGESFPFDYFFPEAFFRHRPSMVASAWEAMTFEYFIKALLITPLKRFRRSLKAK